MPAAKEHGAIAMSVGRLSSIPQLTSKLGRALKAFSHDYQAKLNPEVVWDFRDVEPRHMSMAALTSLIATASRLRQFTNKKSKALISYNPNVFRFLADIGFARTAEKMDLFEWQPEGIFAGFSSGTTHPSTRIFSFPYLPERIPHRDDEEAWKGWKDRTRWEFKQAMLYEHGFLRLIRDAESWERNVRDEEFHIFLNTCAELAVNAILWGQSEAFVGVQVTANSFTAAVCDSGNGLLDSLRAKDQSRFIRPPENHEDAVLLASLANFREYGLRRAIGLVVELGGWVQIATGTAEVQWRKPFWDRAVARSSVDSSDVLTCPTVTDVFGRVRNDFLDAAEYERGFCRKWEPGLRGTRVSLEVPMRSKRFDRLRR